MKKKENTTKDKCICCNGSGFVPISPCRRGKKLCGFCKGKGKMSREEFNKGGAIIG